MHRFYLILIVCFGFFINVQAEKKEFIYDAIPDAEYYDESFGILVPWDGYNTTTNIVTPIPSGLLRLGDLEIYHPENYSLFIDEKLYYRSESEDSLILKGSEILRYSKRDTVWLTHKAGVMNRDLIGVRVSREDSDYAPAVFKSAETHRKSQMKIFLYLLLLLAFVLVRTMSAREFDFYFSGMYIRSPRLSLEKFMGDSLNPFLIFLSTVTISLILLEHIDSLDLLKYQKINFDLLNTNSVIFSFLLVLTSVIVYLLIKRTMYLIFMWLREEQREFSGVWRSYLLSFTNLTFWFFLLYSIPLLLFPNFDFGKFFQIIFFIFAALNAVGGIMVYSNFRIKADLIIISGILAIDIFPIILLVQLLTF
jgi:hypothetical protein